MSKAELLPVDRFLNTLNIVGKEGKHLLYSRGRLYSTPIDSAWVSTLEIRPEVAEQMDAFISRYGRMQDTVADKLLPRWLMALAETPGSQIEVLNRAEKLDVVTSTETWLAARKLRNRLVHEYMTNETEFAQDLMLAKGYTTILIETFDRIRAFAKERMSIEEEMLPPVLNK